MFFNSKIIASGSYLPEKIYTNDYLSTIVDTSDEWIYERTGIKERRIAAEDEYTSDLATKAALNALKSGNIDISSIDCLIIATTTPDRTFPATAVIVQRNLKMREGTFAFDIQAVCSGFIYALSIADNYIKSGFIKRALIIGAETMSRIVDWTDRSTCVLFGDGAGAVVVDSIAQNNIGILSTKIESDGEYFDLLKSSGGVSYNGKSGFVEMQGREIFKMAVNKMYSSIVSNLAKINLTINDIDYLIPHQANKRILDALAKKLNLSEEKMIVTVDKYANTSSSSIPLALDSALKLNKIKSGDLVVMEAFGGGLTWGNSIIRW